MKTKLFEDLVLKSNNPADGFYIGVDRADKDVTAYCLFEKNGGAINVLLVKSGISGKKIDEEIKMITKWLSAKVIKRNNIEKKLYKSRLIPLLWHDKTIG